MKECTEIDRPLISIVIAVYEPNLDWLKEQLESLNKQTYPNLELIVLDDCSHMVAYSDIETLVSECIKGFPYTIFPNDKNMGSNGAFEKLTKQANGEYIAYCDQDDIWLPEKLDVMYRAVTISRALLACSDMYIIDADGKCVANSLTQVRKRQRFLSGEGLASELLYRNFATGCTILAKTDTAKSAIPFSKYMVHDHWLALWCSTKGRIESVDKPLLYYRIHGGNQTDLMAGIKTKEDYYKIRIQPFYMRIEEIAKRMDLPETKKAMSWALARMDNYNRKAGAKKQLFKLRKVNLTTTAFELLTLHAPEYVFWLAVKMIRKGFL